MDADARRRREVVPGGASRLVKRDLAWSGGVAAIALLLYIRTLAPGLTADVDTAMFQFVGRVLGVAHNPGYPLYVLLTHAFSYLPIGSLAYRINLFSALLGGLTVGLAFLIARRLGCRRVIAAAAALGLASGGVFWSQAVIAEVYTLNAAIVAGVLLSLLVWSQTHRARWYFVAVALFAAGLGNHTTIVGFVPGIVIFALLTDARFVLRPRTLAVTAGTLAGGLLQYVFILWRSSQPDAYVESRATSVQELSGVVLGGQFQERLFAFSPRALFTVRLPWLLKSVLVPELADYRPRPRACRRRLVALAATRPGGVAADRRRRRLRLRAELRRERHAGVPRADDSRTLARRHHRWRVDRRRLAQSDRRPARGRRVLRASGVRRDELPRGRSQPRHHGQRTTRSAHRGAAPSPPHW